MKISTDINCFYKVYSEKETVKMLADAGFEAIDYTFMDEKYYGGEISDSECRKYYADLKNMQRIKECILISRTRPVRPARLTQSRTTGFLTI